MSHIFLILPKPDWVQLSNVHIKFDKHMFREAYTLTTCKDKLASLDRDSKIHVIGHGDVYGPASGVTIKDVANALKGSGLPDNQTTIRLDTCSSAGPATNNFAQALLLMLKGTPYNYKTLKVEGTVGPSITGFKEGREVVDPNALTLASDAQKVITMLFRDEIVQAKQLISSKWKEALSSSEIRMLALEVSLKTSDFFKYFRKYLINLEKETGTTILMDKAKQVYKQAYQ